MGLEDIGRHLDGPEICFYSFWKPDPLPTVNHKGDVFFSTIGDFNDVIRSLLRIPNTKPIYCPKIQMARVLWNIDKGVVLHVRGDLLKEVLTIGVTSIVPDEIFYRIYLQVHEQLGVTLLDEVSGEFIGVKEYRARLRSKKKL